MMACRRYGGELTWRMSGGVGVAVGVVMGNFVGGGKWRLLIVVCRCVWFLCVI